MCSPCGRSSKSPPSDAGSMTLAPWAASAQRGRRACAAMRGGGSAGPPGLPYPGGGGGGITRIPKVVSTSPADSRIRPSVGADLSTVRDAVPSPWSTRVGSGGGPACPSPMPRHSMTSIEIARALCSPGAGKSWKVKGRPSPISQWPAYRSSTVTGSPVTIIGEILSSSTGTPPWKMSKSAQTRDSSDACARAPCHGHAPAAAARAQRAAAAAMVGARMPTPTPPPAPRGLGTCPSPRRARRPRTAPRGTRRRPTRPR